MPEDLNIWPTLSTAYEDVFGEINLDVYNAAGEIWQRGRTFAHATGLDDEIAHTAMIRAVAKVSHRINEATLNLQTPGELKAYLFTAFRHSLLDELKREHSKEVTPVALEEIADQSGGESLAAQIERKILLEEIVRHMDPKTRFIYERLILGYSFEEIAEAEGTPSNKLRSMFSKRIKKIASQFAGEGVNIRLD